MHSEIEEDDVVRAILEEDFTRLVAMEDRINGSHFKVISRNTGFPLSLHDLTLMHVAAYANSLECFAWLNSKGLPIDLLSGESYLPLHYACARGALEIVAYILEIDPTQARFRPSSDYFSHHMFLAICSGNNDLVKLLIDYGADINDPLVLKQQPVRTAIKSRNINVLITILENLNNYGKVQINKGFSPIMLAIANRQACAIPLLVENNLDVEYVSETHETALSLCCCHFDAIEKMEGKVGALKIIRLLLDHMTTIDFQPELSVSGAIHWICASGEPAVARLILEHNDIELYRINERGESGPHMLLGKKTENVIEILDILVNHGLDINFKPTPTSNSLLADFVYYFKKDLKVIEWLLQKGAEQHTVGTNKQYLDDYVFLQSRTTMSGRTFGPIADLFKRYRNPVEKLALSIL